MVKSQFGQLEKSRMPKVGGWRKIAAPSGEVPWDLIHEWGETDWCGDDLEAVPICCGEESWEWQRSCQFTGRSAILLSPVEWGTRNRNASPSSKEANWGGLGIRLGIPPGYLLGEVFRVIPTRRPRWRDCISLLAWGCFFFLPGWVERDAWKDGSRAIFAYSVESKKMINGGWMDGLVWINLLTQQNEAMVQFIETGMSMWLFIRMCNLRSIEQEKTETNKKN